MSTRMRNTSGQARSRKAHKKLSAPAITKDNNGPRLRHRVSPETGMYKGRQVLPPAQKASEDKSVSKETKKEVKSGKDTKKTEDK